jgi:hemolysin activation/secretion protein
VVGKWLVTAVGALCFAALPAAAQNLAPPPSQVAPPVIAPVRPAPRISLPQVPAGAEAPAQAKTLFFVLTGLDIDGEFPELAAARTELVAPFVGRRISVAELFELANKLQQAYVNAGYPLARVVTLPQEIGKSARVKLRVIDGFVERIDAEALPWQVRGRVVDVLKRLIRKTHLTQAELERQLLIAGDTPGLVLNAVFGAGNDLGGSLLIVTGRYRAVSATLYIDDAVPKSFGTWQGVSSFSLNSLAGFGEQLSVQLSGHPDMIYTAHPVRRYISATLGVPLGTDGVRAELYATNGRTTPYAEPIFATQGHFDRAYFKLGVDAIKRRDQVLNFNARFEATDERVDLLAFIPPVPHSLDRTRVVRTSFEGLTRWREAGLTFNYSGNFSKGLDAFGARTASDATPLGPDDSTPLLSRQGADAEFVKLDGRFEIYHSLPQDFFWSLALSGQYPFNKPMLTSEQFDITGSKALSGFTSGSLPGDRAWVARGEFGYTYAPLSVMTWTPYAFAAYGERILEMPTNLDIRRLTAVNYGGGLRASLAPSPDMPDLYAFIEWSHRQVDENRNLNGDRIFAGVALRY